MTASLLRAGVPVRQAQFGVCHKNGDHAAKNTRCRSSLSQKAASLSSTKRRSLFGQAIVQPLKQPSAVHSRARAQTVSVVEKETTVPEFVPKKVPNFPACDINPKRRLDIELPDVPADWGTMESPVDVIIVGSGPAGLGAADKASAKGLKVVLVDPDLKAYWMNNYGVWVDEFEALGLADCFTKQWRKANVMLDKDNDIQLDRAYAQVDRVKLKTKLLERCMKQGVGFISSAVDTVDHGSNQAARSKVVLQGGREMHARSVLDATGHARRLVEFDESFTPGYQGAYGITAIVESHPFPLDEMLFMDWREDHLNPEYKKRNETLPTFLYAMPFTENLIFLEETSLVARPAVSFPELKIRLQQRLEHYGIVVTCIKEEEFCLIPMGGVLPMFPQRTLGIGGTAGMVHPSTGFMLSKTLQSADVLINSLTAALGEDKKGESLSTKVWETVWTKADLRLRTFMCFGMETLMKLNIENTRYFFKAFFSMPYKLWSGFLSWRITLFSLAEMGLTLFFNLDAKPRLTFMLSTLPYLGSFLANFVMGNKNNFSSRPWGGISDKVKRKISGNKDDQDDDLTGGGMGGKAAKPEARSVEGKIPLPVKSYKQEDTDFLTKKMEAALGIKLDTPCPASSLRDDRDWTRFQQQKKMADQALAASVLKPFKAQGESLDVLVVGMGPSGLALAAELGERGLKVGVVSPDMPFVNTYGVWFDEFEELGLANTLSHVYEDVLVWMNESDPAGGIDLGRKYGRVGRKELRDHLLERCRASGVVYHADMVEEVVNLEGHSNVTCRGGMKVEARLVSFATGHNREMLEYAPDQTPFGWQTAYGVEVKMPAHPFPLDRAVFMDFRQSDPEECVDDKNCLVGQWRVPSFLYVLPSDKDTVFLEETCLASSVQMPFDELKRRMYLRLARMGLDVDIEGGAVIEEEASWIPLGGPLPRSQRNIAFGAAACMVHPASGYSVTNSLRQAKDLAATMAVGLKDNGCVAEAANSAWEVLWSPEKKRRMAFYQFGMQLIAGLKISELRSFFVTFYALPRDMHQKFLSMDLTSLELLMFAVAFFVNGTNRLRQLLVLHLAAPAGSRFLKIYLDTLLHQFGGGADALAAATQENASRTMIRRSEGKMATPSAMTVEKQQMGERAGLSCGYMPERKDVQDIFGKEAPFDVDMRPSKSGST